MKPKPTATHKLCEAYGGVCQRRFEGQTKEDLQSLVRSLLAKYGDG
jgi:RecB family endonuclease NucS